ncbi:MAG: helix-turn-helix domain-containing protein [Mucilaginibacter sp.]|uniref:helix-turn-helix domain-containing protein n=1 Tax=Mucilaginibacter sp. TaxID=1882438 RepID=UPI0032632498
MEGISLVETSTLETLISEVRGLRDTVLSGKPDRYLSSSDAAAMMGFSEVWICNNKQHIGYSTIGKSIRFKVRDIEAYMEANYFKIQSKRKGK